MERIQTIMRWLQDNKYMGGSVCNDYETAKDLIARLDALADIKARATAPNKSHGEICSTCSGGAMDGVTLSRNPDWFYCPACGRKLSPC